MSKKKNDAALQALRETLLTIYEKRADARTVEHLVADALDEMDEMTGGTQWEANPSLVDAGLMVNRPLSIERENGTRKEVVQIRLTPAGIARIAEQTAKGRA